QQQLTGGTFEMSDQIATAFVQQYKGTLYNLVQQKGSRLREAVTAEAVNGEFGATAAIERTSRHSDSPLVNTPHSRHQVTMRDFEWGDLIDNSDKVRLLVDPSSSYLQSAMWGARPQVGRHRHRGGAGVAKTGKTRGTTVALPSAQKLAVASSGLTLRSCCRPAGTYAGNRYFPGPSLCRGVERRVLAYRHKFGRVKMIQTKAAWPVPQQV
ncbi:MAG TPA: phage capsid protein, partial [Acidobacteriaceae bacterium]|nr:phage capsid protein [Acidobacteriaceae bacterium]